MNRIIKAVRQRLFIFLMKNSRSVKSDSLYVFLFYLFATGRFLSLNNPKRFSEKLQVLKVKRNTDPKLGDYVDKLNVRSIVAEKIGEHFLNQVYCSFNSPDELDFDKLIYPCVVKTTHDSGTVFPLKEKPNHKKREEIRYVLNKKLAINYFWKGRETPYKYASPKILVEKYLFEREFDSPIDYKFFCFDGTVKLLQVTMMKDGIQYVNYYDEFGNIMELRSGSYDNFLTLKLPAKINEMYQLAATLSDSICHVRVDFYCIDEVPYFGEYTFHSDGGLLSFSDDSFDEKLGSYIKCV